MSSIALERELTPRAPETPRHARTRTAERTRPALRLIHSPVDEPEPAVDAQALVTALYAEYGTTLLTYVTRLLADPYQAEDVVQETMLRAWRNADRLTPERGSVSGWLTRVAHNIAVDKIRARKARPAEVDEGTAEPSSLGDHATTVVDSLFLADALTRLSPAHRETLREVYFADQTAAQAAETLGLPIGTVKSRIYHALPRLRACLEQMGVTSS
jgi:RNA polymerase sigma-70 factor (ECF subfamily)